MLMNFNWSNLNISFDYVLNSYAIMHYKSIKFKGEVCYICMCLFICIHTLVMHPCNGYYCMNVILYIGVLYSYYKLFKKMYTMFLVKNTCIYILLCII
jgi:hypothetical protein